ncbi:dipeptidyl-peptidase 3 [Colletotrichum lupini]|uniref:Dipeptidyl-peptidase 3 n=1 Tax=Colletotrichum lupini TaxID=145971 RepID=A0A9Q8WPH0_9PEZI|nr:dipeptidyl-peptidase 3 [Colletotrichum lupini]UQC90711.1 dipeptidyl-peptidase 3 [Colletotrichum lupini]
MEVQSVQVFRLDVRSQFEGLSKSQQRYAHHMARAAWHGARIVLRQTSPESLTIFDFILELHAAWNGGWDQLADEIGIKETHQFLTYAAAFLSNLGNYYGSGDQKFIPAIPGTVFAKIATKSDRLQAFYSSFADAIYSSPPFSLGYPGETTQSTYYPGNHITKEEIAMVSQVLEQKSILPENTRLRKLDGDAGFELQIASSDDGSLGVLPLSDGRSSVKLVMGDHAAELEKILAKYRESLRNWVKDKAPEIENIFGFVEPYRDPHGIRAEFEGLVAIADAAETRKLTRLNENSTQFIRKLPWASPENDGKGVFEKSLFDPPDLSSIHTLAYCSSIIFPGINLPNYNDIRQETGFKNVIIANRMVAESKAQGYPFIEDSEEAAFRRAKFPTYYWWVVLHELLGHGTGRMMVETTEGDYNFDIQNPPINPLDDNPIKSWYKPGQTWTGQFGDLATTVDECRAELVGAYLMDDKDLLRVLGFTDATDVTADDIAYNMYQQLGVDGLRGLANYNVDSKRWGQAHSRAHFAILNWLLKDGGDCVEIEHDKTAGNLTVRVNRAKVSTHGKPALGRMLLRLHMYRCTADVQACRVYYEMLTRLTQKHLEWRKVVVASKPPPLVFVHANTSLEENEVTLREYEPTVEGLIKSWAERRI